MRDPAERLVKHALWEGSGCDVGAIEASVRAALVKKRKAEREHKMDAGDQCRLLPQTE